MNIIVVGNYKWPHYQQALLDGFEKCKNQVKANPLVIDSYPVWNLLGILSNTYKIYRHVKKTIPDVLFLYRVDFILPWVLPLLKKKYRVRVLVYHNDDPYRNTLRRRIKHFFFLKSIKFSDITYVYREVNEREAYEWGAIKVKLMRSHYYSKLDRLSQDKDIYSKKKEIVFIGHYEEDSRIKFLDALFHNGINVHVYGSNSWKTTFLTHQWPLSHLHGSVYNEEYRKTLGTAYAALAFFSERNRDDYTRRCFEIPMVKTLLFAPRTNYMSKTFTDGVNVILFESEHDIVQKAQEIFINPQRTSEITKNGYNFVRTGKFSEVDVAEEIIKDINNL